MTGHRGFEPPPAGWQNDAACHGVPSTVMFPQTADGPLARALSASGLRLCAECPVTHECEQHWNTLPSSEQIHGIWFGTTPNDRANQRRAARQARNTERTST